MEINGAGFGLKIHPGRTPDWLPNKPEPIPGIPLDDWCPTFPKPRPLPTPPEDVDPCPTYPKPPKPLPAPPDDPCPTGPKPRPRLDLIG